MEVYIVLVCYLIELDPSVCNALSLLALEGSLAFNLVFKGDCCLSSLCVVRVPPYFDRVRVYIVVLKERNDVILLGGKGESSHPDRRVVI